MNSILFWTLILVGSGLFVYLVPYRNIKIIQKLQQEGLEKLDKIIELLKKKLNLQNIKFIRYVLLPGAFNQAL